jgi:GNAT superfamily N-acetyltransferase
MFVMSTPLNIDICFANVEDADTIARLHAQSWRTTYVGMLPEAFLEGPLEENRRALWRERFGSGQNGRSAVLKALLNGEIVGFACVLFDADRCWGPLLDNLHIHPSHKRLGIGRLLFTAARNTVIRTQSRHFHLWVLEANTAARRFYEALGGTPVEARSIEVVPTITVPEIRYVWTTSPDEHR